jgi:hypothetical protein
LGEKLEFIGGGAENARETIEYLDFKNHMQQPKLKWHFLVQKSIVLKQETS